MNVNLVKFYHTAFWVSLVGILAFIFDFGFTQATLTQQIIDGFYFVVITIGLAATFARYIDDPKLLSRKVAVFDAVSIIYTCYIFYMYLFVGEAFKTDLILENPLWVVLAVILTFIREFFELKIDLNRTYLNPAQLFILSFLSIIFFGALLLMLPKATHGDISFIDALFTATSAVCVTGLIVVDTATYFTVFGQSIILFLIQVGGLGILTFASFLVIFLKAVLPTKISLL